LSGVAASLLVVALLGGGESAVERRLVLMGTEAEVRVVARDRAAALAGSEAAVRALEAAEARLSTWSEESELARLNRGPVGEPVALSPLLAAELAAAEACRRETGGAFDAGVGPLVDAWGLRTGGRLPHPQELAAARAASGGDGLELREDRTAVRRRPGLRIEEGGFGKGAALDAALAAAAAVPGVEGAWIDLGGQVAALPDRSLEIAIAHPGDRDRPLVALALDPALGGSVATSGNSERGITVAGERRSHLLDPRTGEPAPDFGSLTVWAPTALRADCLSTGLYVLGPEEALAWAAAHPGVEVVVLRSEGGRGDARAGAVEVLATPGLEGRLRVVGAESVTAFSFGLDSTPGVVPGNEERRGAGASDAVEAGRARRPPSDRGRRVGARRPHDPEESIYVPF
jgi:thiamine biosynthesis lipoprotein